MNWYHSDDDILFNLDHFYKIEVVMVDENNAHIQAFSTLDNRAVVTLETYSLNVDGSDFFNEAHMKLLDIHHKIRNL